MAQQWYCKIMDSEVGPLTSSQLVEMARDGRVQPSTSVRMADSSRWITAGSVKGLFKNTVTRQRKTRSAPAAASSSRSPSKTEWYYANAGQQLGPVSNADLKQLIAAGQILPATQVWREGMPEWVPAHTVPGLLDQGQPGGTQVPPSIQPPVSRMSPQARPRSVTVFGILGCVLGGLGLLGSLWNLINMENTSEVFPNAGDGYKIWLIVSTGLNFLSSIWLLCSGIGLLRMRPWGRSSSIAWCYYSIVMAIIGFAAVIIFLVIPSANESPAVMAAMLGGAIGGVLMGLVYSILFLVFMLRPNVRAAFQ